MEELERPASSRSIRPSRFTQTISRFKGIIRIPVRKVTTLNGPNAPQKPSVREGRGRGHQQPANHPYSRTPTAIRRESMKPYMSQPMLGLQRSSMDTDPYQHSHPDSDMSSSASPDPSPSRLNSDFPLPTSKGRLSEDSRRHSRRLSLHSLASQPIDGISAQVTVPQPKAIDGLPRQSLRISTSEDTKEPTPPTPPPKSARHLTPKSMPEVPTSPPKPLTTDHSTPSAAKPSTITLSPSPSPPRTRPPRPIRPLPQVPSGLSRASSLTAAAMTTEKQPAARLAEPRPNPVTYDSSPAVPTRISLASPPMPNASSSEAPIHRALSNPPLEALLRSASEADGQTLQVTINNEASPSGLEEGPTTPTRPLKISLPNLSRRISLLQATNGGARLSPTVLHRPLPLPILNLPKLPPTMPSSGDDVLAEGSSLSRRRSERVGLGSMPALPLQGALRGAGGHEEPDDTEDDDEEMEDIDEDATEDDHSYSHGHDDDDVSAHNPGTATSDSSSASGFSDEGLLGRGSYDLPSPSEASGSVLRRSAKPELPPLSVTSPLDIRFQAETAPSLTPGMIRNADGVVGSLSDKKGKQRQAVPSPLSSGYASSVESEPSPDMGVSTSRNSRPSLILSTPRPSSYRPFALAGEYVTVPQSIAPSRSEGSDKTPSAQPRTDPFLNSSPPSPLATPRAISQVGDSPTSNFNVNWQRHSVILGSLGSPLATPGTPLVQRPSFYKRASRSLVDLHSIATKEAIEKLLREEEEKQERVRRQMLLKRNVGTASVAGAGVTANTPLLPPSMPEETLPKRASEANATRIASTMREGATRLEALGGPSSPETSKLATTGSNLAGEGDVGPSVPRMDGGIRSSMLGHGGIGGETKQQNRISMAPAYEVATATSFANPLQAPLRRRRSMPTYNESTDPPPYPSFAPFPLGRHAKLQIAPREDEGHEELPCYSNSIYLKAIMPRKMEFSSPGVQAKDRKWRRVMCVLEGTVFKVYRCPVGPGGVSAIEQWWESKVGAGDSVSYPSGPGSSAASPPGPGSARARANANVDAARSREEEKASQQYLHRIVQDELTADGGSRTPDEELDEQSASRIQLPPPPSVHVQRHPHHPPPAPVAISKSALNLAVHFLKPGSRHTRSSSDAGPPSPSLFNNQPRSSLNLPRSGATTPTSSSFSSTSRSHSPLPSASTSTTTVADGVRSHSPMPSSRLVVPSSSSTLASRPTTPSTGCSSGRSSSRMRNHDAPTPPRSARSDTSSKLGDDIPDPHERDLLKCYTMQNAESGLGNDYLKRKNVIRVRLEGEQFLLQAKDVPSVVQWIEGLQSATNVALDLDDRPMPRGPIFPRRRRRRRPAIPPINTESTAPAIRPATVTETYTPTSATAGQPALRRT
ncbi:hypothetical protein FA13DRAFT_77126 [Coprinellus micaceus]|uniref:PH domain-containing protein n=1 Tax=Coprinellus micaceus TaxID=71717 RepID=A0A4Y7TJW2_COPMI|nr:hypothetical protein FA13DRAFT_77126 [Coprinellus micaceus]